MRRSLLVLVGGTAFLATLTIGGVTIAGSATVTPTKTVTITASGCPGGKKFCFAPAVLMVPPSTKVTWKNNTKVPHTVTRCTVPMCGVKGGTGTDPNLRSPLINTGRTLSFTFHHPGTYVYYCQVHGYVVMHGIVTVT
jgi:plastocyanin